MTMLRHAPFSAGSVRHWITPLLFLSIAATSVAQNRNPEFLENAGQWPAELAARAQVGGGTAWFLDDGVTLLLKRLADDQDAAAGSVGGPARKLEQTELRLRFTNGARRVLPVAEGGVGAPTRWGQSIAGQSIAGQGIGPQSGAVSHAREALRYRSVWPGIDAVFRGVHGRIAYEFDVAPNTAASSIELTCGELAAPLAIGRDGSLLVTTTLGVIRHTTPRSFELAANGSRIEVPSHFELRGDGRFGFAVERIDPTRALWIDPGIDWMTMFGGAGFDQFLYAEHAVGTLHVGIGWSDSAIPAPWGSSAPGGADGTLVSAFDTNGATLLWTTMIDGANLEWPLDSAFDASTGLTSIVGITSSPNLPVTANALQPNLAGGYDGWLAQVDLAGSIVYLTYLGGVAEDRLVDVSARAGIVTVIGATASTTLPTTAQSWQPVHAGGIDAYVAQIDPSLPAANQIVNATYIGSAANEGGTFDSTLYWKNFDMKHVHVAANGEVTVVTNTFTAASTLPTTPGAYDATPNGIGDTWVARLDASLSTLLSATFVGGSSFDLPLAVAVDQAGLVTMGLATQSANLPTTPGAFDASFAGTNNDSFLVRIDLGLSGNNQLVYGSYFGGAGVDETNSVILEPSSSIATFVGQTRTVGFGIAATTGAHLSTPPPNGAYDFHGFVLRVDMAGNGLDDVHYASYISPAPGTEVLDITQDDAGRFLLVGDTFASAFASSSSGPQIVSGGGFDGFAILMDLLPTGVKPIGVAGPACAPLAHMQVNSAPSAGNANFQLLCENAPAGAIGVLAVGTELPSSLPVFGIDAYVAPISLLMVPSDSRGFASFSLPVPGGVAPPFGLAAQFAWLTPNPCAGNLLSASNALGF